MVCMSFELCKISQGKILIAFSDKNLSDDKNSLTFWKASGNITEIINDSNI
jgi:hypothetical protein